MADRLAKTPSVGLEDDVGIGLKTGSSVTVRWTLGVGAAIVGGFVFVLGDSDVVVVVVVVGSALINLCRSSPSFSASDASPSSKASSRSLSCSSETGS